MTGSRTCVVLLYRRIFYAVLVICSSLLLIFTITRLVYTIRPRKDRALFDGKSFYDPSVAELCFCGIVTILFSFSMLFVLSTRIPRPTISRNWFELICSATLWALWLGGTAASSAIWFDLNFCIANIECRMLQAILAFAWLGWISITAQLGITVFILIRTGDWGGHIFERPQQPVTVEDESSYMEQRAGSELDAITWPYQEGRSQGTESCHLSSFSAVVPHWLAWSDGRGSQRSSMAPTTPASRRQSRQTRRKSSLATRATFPELSRTKNQPPDFV